MKFNLCIGVYLIFVSFGLNANSLSGFNCPQDQKIVNGLNKKFKTEFFTNRTFYAEFPHVREGAPVGVIFSWHGAGDTIESWRRKLPLADESTSAFPFIVITPHDLGLTPHGDRKGFGWELFKSEIGDRNYEAVLFENVLGCLGEQFNISPSHIYSAGFSAGAMVSNMLISRYPNILSAVYSASGSFWNDENQSELLRLPFGIRLSIKWNEMPHYPTGAVLLADGGENDVFRILGKEVFSFSSSSDISVGFLFEHDKTVVKCRHYQGHLLNPVISTRHIVQFFKAHKIDSPSPLFSAQDLAPSLRSMCEVFHP